MLDECDQVFARDVLVIGNENEQNCNKILDELRTLRDQSLRESPHAEVPSIPDAGTCS